MAFLFVHVAIWGVRFYCDHNGGFHDLGWVIVFLLLHHRKAFFSQLLNINLYKWIAAATLLFGTVFYYMIFHQRSAEESIYSSKDDKAPKDLHFSHTLLKPLVFPCRTSHTRMFPRKHSFSYSYLFVGIPIGWQGSSGAFLSAGGECFPKGIWSTHKSWLSVEAADYLNRGDHPFGLQGKLVDYLKSHVGLIDNFKSIIILRIYTG